MRYITIASVALAVLIGSARFAEAFQIETAVTTGCHERITLAAIEAAGWPAGEQPPEPTETERRFIADLPFDLPAWGRDPWTAALVIGVRYNDIEDNDPTDLAALVSVHNSNSKQPRHCLRQLADDGPDGDAEALVSCREFILEELALALGSGDAADLTTTEEVEVYLVFRDSTELELQRFAYHAGRALHALQDSFTHSFRNPDDSRIRGVLNWIEGNLSREHIVARDGHEHLDVLDDCSSSMPAIERREAWAREASTALLAAVADPQGGRAGRLTRAAAVLDAEFNIEAGCGVDNRWCDSVEPTLGGCAAAPGSLAGTALLVLALLALGRRGRWLGAVMVVMAVASASGDARAQPEAADATSVDESEQQVEQQERVIESLDDTVKASWGVAGTIGGALDRGAGAIAGGVRFNPWRDVGLGLDLEYNPWISLSNQEIAAGVATLAVPVHWTLKRFGSWELRTTARFGASMLLFDLVGAGKGSIGPFVGWNPLGLAIPLGGSTKLIVAPGDIAVPIPQITGIPFYYHQYRFTVGVEWYPRGL